MALILHQKWAPDDVRRSRIGSAGGIYADSGHGKLLVSPDEPTDLSSITIARNDIIDDLIDTSRPRHTLRPDMLIALPIYAICIMIDASKFRGAGPNIESTPPLSQLANADDRAVRPHETTIRTQDVWFVADITLLCGRRRCEESCEPEEEEREQQPRANAHLCQISVKTWSIIQEAFPMPKHRAPADLAIYGD
jgi:hypothetical protein